MADSLWARLAERFDEYSSLPSVEAAARDDDDDAEFGQRHTARDVQGEQADHV